MADDGAALCPVKVGEGAVRHHLNADGGEEAVQEWRLRLYGDVYASPLAYAPAKSTNSSPAPGKPGKDGLVH